MAYIINTSASAVAVIELSQGRVQLEPLKYCELHAADIEKARKFYNSAELNLYVAETDRELDLILKPNENTQKDENIDTENTISDPISAIDVLDPIEPSDSSDQMENQSQIESDPIENAVDILPVPVAVSENIPVDPIEENVQDQKEVLKNQIISRVELCKQQRNLIALKELAAKLGVPFMHNISIEKLANRIVQSLNN